MDKKRREALVDEYLPMIGHYIYDLGFEIGDGWLGILEELFPKIYKIKQRNGLEYEIIRVMEINGELNIFEEGIFRDHGTPELYQLIDEAKRKSRTICADCGCKARGRRRRNRKKELYTLCDVCLVIRALDES